ncbi:regulator of microtubule dynamics protein 1-like [Pomacea canaliculata]|uniref:regulator of microtubule dynamics protein 1-like n=1 Tax=Pomacea canaliculata TaxID=400727 RepID=UPI000D736D26|nr:regulator of microtubule dynamics protein 1-like [Pomacea canaliculata]
MEKSKLTKEKAQRRQLIQEAFSTVERALALNDKNFACHKWYGILLDAKAEYDGTKARLLCAYKTKEHFLRAAELNQKDATTLYLLGIWCFTFADLPWYQRKIASAIFTTPPSSTYDEALKYFHRAEQTDPSFYSKNTLMLGKTYLRLGNKKMALLYLTKAREFPLNTEDDRDANKEAEELLKSMGIKF